MTTSFPTANGTPAAGQQAVPGRPPAPARHWRERCLLRTSVPLRWLPAPRNDGFGILTWHQVAPAPRHDPHLLNVTPQRFRRQLAGLLELGYRPWRLGELLARHRAGEPAPPRAFAVVFDDGYRNVYHYAWPVLRELEIPATIFLATAYLDRAEEFPFDDVAGAETGPDRWPLSSEQCREMAAEGLVDLGSHTHTHQDFRGRTREFRDDVARSLEVLRQSLGQSEVTFSFPYGRCDARLAAAAREMGLLCSLTAECQRITPGSDPFAWGRFGATELDTPGTLAAKLDGWYTWLRGAGRRIRMRPLRSR